MVTFHYFKILHKITKRKDSIKIVKAAIVRNIRTAGDTKHTERACVVGQEIIARRKNILFYVFAYSKLWDQAVVLV